MRFLTYIIILIIAVLGVLFASLNAEPVVFNYYIGVKQLPLSMLLALVFVVGSFFGLFFGLLMYWKARYRLSHCKKQVKLLEKELTQARAAH